MAPTAHSKIGLVCSYGGHLTEMLELFEAFSSYDLFFVTYDGPRAQELAETYRVYTFTNFGYNGARMAGAMPRAWRILHWERPRALVSTGSEIAIPFFLLARMIGIHTIFVESWCRVRTRSGTGRVLYPLADEFFVQWPQLHSIYGSKARYVGGLL